MKAIQNKRAMTMSLFLNGALISALMLPLVSMITMDTETQNDQLQFIEIAFEDGDMSPSSASTKPVEVKETKSEVKEEKSTVEKSENKSSEAKENSEISPWTERKINMKKGDNNDSDKISTVEGNQEEKMNTTSKENESERGEGSVGESITGKALANMEFEGEGVFGRQVVYHAKISELAEKDGKVVVNLCINRSGIVTHIAFNESASTITDYEYIKKVLKVATKYRFEKDYSAPDTQCGKLTFIFKID